MHFLMALILIKILNKILLEKLALLDLLIKKIFLDQVKIVLLKTVRYDEVTKYLHKKQAKYYL